MFTVLPGPDSKMGGKSRTTLGATMSALHVPEARLPVELLCYMAHFLSYSDACASVNVSRLWRQTLLADKSLWTHVQVLLLSSDHGRWLSTIRTLVRRSAGRPLTLELATEDRVQGLYAPGYLALERVATFLAEHMSVLEVLNLSIPTCVTPCWDFCLRMEAPLLRSFRLYTMTYYDSEPPLPAQLFGGHAPLLKTLCLEQAFLRYELIGSSALQHITSLYYHNSHNCLHERDMFEFLNHFMPNLTQLTCTVLDNYGDYEFTYQHPIDLRLLVAPRVSSMAARFPRATYVTYSYFSRNLETGGLLSIVEEAVRTQEPATSVDISWAPGPRDMPYWLGSSHEPAEHHALTVNGHPLIVDIYVDTLRATLTPVVVVLLTSHVRALSVVGALWPVFSCIAMPALEELTLYLRAGTEDAVLQERLTAPRLSLKAVRFTRTTSISSTPDLEISAALIEAFVGNTVAADCMPTLYLSGICAVGDGCAGLAGVTDGIVYEPQEHVEDLEQWSWDLSD